MEGNTAKKKKSNRGLYISLGFLFVCAAVVLLILFLLHGSTVITNGPSESSLYSSLTCEGDGIDYPIFTYDKSIKKHMKIVALFNDKKLNSINLIYQLYYDSASDVKESINQNHAAMNLSFSAIDLPADSFDAKYSNLGDNMQMALYANNNVDGMSAKYFLLNNATNIYDKQSMAKVYAAKGLNCVTDN